jgi:hypothetical protein
MLMSKNIWKWHKNGDPEWHSTREEVPLDEFSELEELLVGAFPHVFVLETAYNSLTLDDSNGNDETQNKMKGVSKQHFRHLVLQNTTAATTIMNFFFIYLTTK